mmetsp:Transcript_21511/g.32242  ORF Transcript_21511/g.32242 Transcript_21511/m.32242 type:complete len:196 (-) Transcript_21511:256-843(-)
MEDCAICLQELSNDIIGTFVPCGHCIHVACFEEYRLRAQRGGPAGTTKKSFPDCPICLSHSIHFQRIYLSSKYVTCTKDDEEVPEAHKSTANCCSPPPTKKPRTNNSNSSIRDHHSVPSSSISPETIHQRTRLSLEVLNRHLEYTAMAQYQTMLYQREVNMINTQILNLFDIARTMPNTSTIRNNALFRAENQTE